MLIGVILVVVVLGGYVIMNMTNTSENESSTTSNESSKMMDDSEKMDKEMASKTIVDIASADENFSTLVQAVQAAGLVETLASEGPFTVFAPTNSAFAKLPAGTVEGLLEDPEQLANILTYHVVAGKVLSSDLSDGMTATTVQGQTITISLDDTGVMVNDATVVQADIEASNGVIHVIDSVILPE